jgi:hypothetical protein
MYSAQLKKPSPVDEVTEEFEHLPMLGSGCSRTVFQLNERFVLKIPRWDNQDGLSDNEIEHRLYRQHLANPLPFPPAKCRAFWYKGVRLLIMEAVIPIGFGADQPDWNRELCDSRQNGYNAKGEAVCYDYGCEDHFLRDRNV